MTKSVLCHEIIVSFPTLHDVLNDSINFRNSLVSKEYRFQVSFYITGQDHTILFLIRTGQLVFLDNSVHVILTSSTTYDTILSSSVHRLGVDIKFSILILNQPSLFLKHIEILHALVINSLGVNISSCRAVNLSSGNM